MWKKTVKYFNDYCEHSSIIGCNYICEKRSKGERLLWIFLVAIATGVSFYYIMEMWYKYEDNPFVVTLATREQPIFTIPFPAVTICPVVKTDRDLFNYTEVVHKLWDNETVTDEEKVILQYLSYICQTDDINHYLNQNESFTEEIYERLRELDDTEELLKVNGMCEFMGEDVNCEEVFEPIILGKGICYTFNMLRWDEIYRSKVYKYELVREHLDKSSWTNDGGYAKGLGKNVYPRRALQAGAENALSVVIPQRARDTDYLCINNAAGYSVSIHSPNTVPGVNDYYSILGLGMASRIALKPNVMQTSDTVKSYKTVDRQCYFSDERYLEYFQSYTQHNCYLECLTNYTLKICGCVAFYMPRENSTKICGNALFDCIDRANDELKQLEIDAMLETTEISHTKCNCLPLCTQLSYETEVVNYNFPAKKVLAANKKLGISQEQLDFLNFSYLQIYFKYEQFLPSEKNELYGFFDFLSNFGGLLGLFTGFSLLSLAEILYYVSVRLWCNHRLYNDLSGPPAESV